MDQTKLKELGLRLFEINAFKFGDFKMKVGINSPVYFDLRVIVSYPDVMETVAELLTEFIRKTKVDTGAHLCGVPYTALPVATLISIKANKPMLIRRKEAKTYGTKKLIEGKFNAGDKCLIIEDVVTSGSSILDTVNDLRAEGLVVTDAIVVVDREQGGVQNTEEQGVRMHSLFTLSFLLNVLLDKGLIEDKTVQSVAKYIECAQIKSDGSFMNGNGTKVINELSRVGMTYEARADLAKCPISKELMKLIATKKSTLCLAADLTRSEDILNLVERVGPYICILKTHVDIVEDFNENFVKSLQSLAKKHNFMIMEDRKFADIGNTVALQYSGGPFKISRWADLVTVHSLPGQGVLKGLKSVLNDPSQQRGVFLLAEMSSQGNLTTAQYSAATMKIATEMESEFVAGIVCQSSDLVAFPGQLQLTPGVKIEGGVDGMDQKYNSPEHVVKEKGADICVVGRGIIEAKNQEDMAKTYRDRLWAAYCERVGVSE
ncbi:uridine 5'-monophosphate synthase-like [Uranotaenia lowii]|uniref:uridine 5'-monophosphate synthase-like n=1 Tax=Uranotaenia lowii TaxID=190385 RepID=UPI00247AD5DF|nr:uridine 5'-monophosphate synthase-like [Uranotaenia lowii]XP_055609029.1 uridine 5'-monophosphate synthase-like [Uranotaenia lowii]